MNNDFKIIYKILSVLQSSMDYPKFDIERISAQALEISKNRLDNILEMLFDAGYIKGISIRKYEDGDFIVILNDIRITLKGLEYLEENTLLRRVQKELKGIKDSIPGM